MDETTRTHRPARRRSVIAGVAIAGVLLTGGAAWAIHAGAVSRNDDGSVAIDGGQLRPVYDGAYVTQDQLAGLQKQGKAMLGLNNRELACQGITLYLDTEDQVQAVTDDFNHRHPITSLATHTPGDPSDPCAAFTDAPHYVTDKG
jgi:hypothetical protein